MCSSGSPRVAQHVLDDRVDTVLQPVRGARHRPTCGKRRPGKGEELPLAEEFLQPPAAAAQLLVRAPLEGEDFSAFAVDGDDQAPAVAHVRAVGHDRVALRVRRAMRGRIDQHHAIRLRRARASPVDSDAVWDDAPAAMRGTPPASAPVCGRAAASSSSAGRPGISTVACPCRSVRSSSSHARMPGISSLCWMAFSHHPAHHRERIIFHAGKKTCRHAYSYKARPRS